MPAPHILIAGAGIGGLTAALALARRGIAVTIAEKRTRFAETGAGVQIGPNAGHILDALDLALPLKRVSVPVQRLSVRHWQDGRTIAGMPMTQAGDAVPFRAMRRADLHTILLDAARSMPNIRFIVGRGLQDVVETPAGIEAALLSESGHAETVAALCVVGADGLWSRLRDWVDPVAQPRFTGYEAWRAVIPADAASGSATDVTLHLGRARHAVHYPVAGGRETNLVVVREAKDARPGWSREGESAIVSAHVAGAAPALRALVAAAPEWQVWSLHDRPPARMAKGRLALLGDAAHPVLPFMAQGAAMAIEDAGVLAHHLAIHLARDGEAGIEPALAAYATARAARVERVQQTSRRNGAAYHLGWPGSIVRDLVMRRLGDTGMRARNAWLYDWRMPA